MRLIWLTFAAVLIAAVGLGISFQRPKGPPRYDIVVLDYGWHTGVFLPRPAFEAAARRAGAQGALTLMAQLPKSAWIELGWGEAEIYPNVATVDDISLGQGARALLLPSDSVLMLAPMRGRPAQGLMLRISDQGLEGMARFLDGYVAQNRAPIDAAYTPGSQFFEARGAYSVLRTCNSWTAGLLRAGGIAASPLLATTSAGLLWELDLRHD